MHHDYEDLRPALLEDARNHFIASKPTDWFDDCLVKPDAEFWSQETADRIATELQRKGVLDETGWHELNALIKSTKNENVSYAQFVHYYESIAVTLEELWGSKAPPRTTRYYASSAYAGSNDDIAPGYKPDGRFVLISDSEVLGEEVGVAKGPRFNNADTAGVTEWNLSDSNDERAQNEEQTAAGPCLLFYNDARRTRAYALSIEKSSTRLWCFDRGAIRTTERFDCNENPAWVIRFFLYLTFADKEKLGYDPTIRRIKVNKGPTPYIYECEGVYYRTIGQPLAEEDAFSLISRGARIWRVRKCDKNGTVESDVDYVLKDYWLRKTHDGEKAKQDAVCASPALNDEDREIFRNGSITILSDIIVDNSPTIPWVEERWTPQRFASLKKSNPRRFNHPHANTSYKSHVLDTLPPGGPSTYKVKGTPRSHRRMITEEWCISFYRLCDPGSGYIQVGNLKVLLEVISHLVQTLDVVRKAGFVHRDVSAGNCLAYWDKANQRWRGLLSDFEYCKPYGSTSSGDPITGTLIFAAVETRSGYLFMPAPPRPEDPASEEPSSKNASLPIRYHPFYDLEALYWVAVWLLLNYLLVIGNANDTMDEDCLDVWRRKLDDIFNPERNTRSLWLLEGYSLDGLINDLVKLGWSPDVVKLIYPVLRFGPRSLSKAYRELELKLRTEGNQWVLSEFISEPYHSLRDLCLTVKRRVESLEKEKGVIKMIFVRNLLEEQEKRKRDKAAKERANARKAKEVGGQKMAEKERGQKRKADEVEK
ncbi:hypothetical protein BKA70DRAFT_1557096 [Coprinopsis sp. MPI-PUGE-AT-0042]|nr:hypothetical protein BKA70DRAFT_1557096 [Coprinopsis sp. MPI-PUGE-AT-0042]